MINELIHLAFWLPVAILETVSWVYLWQAKEYRLDRFRAHWHTQEGKRDILPIHFLFQIMVGLLVVWWLPNSIGFWVMLAFLLNRLFFFTQRWWRKRLWLPIWTLKARLVVLLSLAAQSLFLLFLVDTLPLWQSIFWTQLLIPVKVLVAVLGLVLPARAAKKRIIVRARKKIEAHPELKVIGITGSYGKTSTKEFLVSFLKTMHRVFMTHERENTLIGIAQRINQGLTDEDQYFVVEMGAYQPGEIARMCQLTPPHVAVVTALAPQHLGLFNTFDRLVAAKMELVEGVDPKGYVVANGDESRLFKEIKTRTKKVHFYSLHKESAELRALEVKVLPRKISFTVVEKDRKYFFTAPLLGRQNVPNLLAAITVARQEGIGFSELQRVASKLKPMPGTMRLVPTQAGPAVVDDAYNANPEAVLAAIDYLNIYLGQKWLVLQPMIELGSVSVSEHRRVLEVAFRVCDRVVMTNINYWSGLKDDFPERDWAKIKLVRTRGDFEKLGIRNLKKGDAVLFEGKETHKYLEQLVGHAV